MTAWVGVAIVTVLTINLAGPIAQISLKATTRSFKQIVGGLGKNTRDPVFICTRY